MHEFYSLRTGYAIFTVRFILGATQKIFCYLAVKFMAGRGGAGAETNFSIHSNIRDSFFFFSKSDFEPNSYKDFLPVAQGFYKFTYC